MLQRVISVAIVILIAIWILSNPAAAGDTIHGWITGVITFFHHLL
jgi:hypothetical protein